MRKAFTMHFINTERTALFIDGANLYSASRHLGFDVDYRNMLEYFRSKTNIVRAYYYSALLDSDFRRLVEAVQRQGVRVSVVSSVRTSPPMVADELRRQADRFVELAEIAPEFTRRTTDTRRPATRQQTEGYDSADVS